MAVFVIPADPPFNVAAVEQVKESDFVINTHLNGYIQALLYNDKNLDNKISGISETVTAQMDQMSRNIMATVNTSISNMQQEVEQNAVQECTNVEIDSVLTTVFGS